MPTYDVTVEGAEYEVDAPDENTAWQWAYTTHKQGAKPASTERTTGEAVSDIGKQFKGGIGALAQFPGQLYGLATGDFGETGLYGWGKRTEKAAEEAMSPGYKAREAARAAKIAEAEKTGELQAFGTALGETVTDPGLLLGFLAKQAPQLIVPGGAAAGVGRAALRRGLAKGVEEVAAREAAIKAGAVAAKGVGAAMQGADIGADTYAAAYDKLVRQGTPEPEAAAQAINLARGAGASAGVISWLAQNLPGASRLEEALAGRAAPGVFRGAVSTAAGETLGEIPEEVGGRLAENIALRTIDPTQRLTEKLGETGAMAALGAAGLGGGVGAVSGLRGGARAEPAARAREEAQQRVLAARAKEAQEAAAPRGYTVEGQAQLFSPEELAGIKRPKEAAAPAEPIPAEVAPPAEQLQLPLEDARTLSDYEQEFKRLKELSPQTAQLKERLAELKDRIQPLRAALTPRGYTAAGQGRLFTPTELKEAGIKKAKAEEAAPTAPLTAEQMERRGQQRLDFTAPEAEVSAPTEPVPEPTLAPKRAVPAELQPTINKLTEAGVRPETLTWAANAKNRPFLRKLTEMAPAAAPEARKALKLTEGSSKAEVFDALFPQPAVPAFRPAPGEGKPRVGVPSEPAVAPPATPAPRAGESVGRGVVPAGRVAPAAVELEGKPAPALEPHTAEFTTAKGSTYKVYADGTTLRTKAARADVGHEGDFGAKPRSVKTIYLDADASRLSAAGVSDMKNARVVLKNGLATLVWATPKTGKFGTSDTNKNIPYHTEPAVGRYPLELWQSREDVPGYEAYAGMHAGNKITDLRTSKAEAATAKKAKAEKAKAEREAAVAKKAEEAKAKKEAKRKAEPVVAKPTEVEEPSAVFGESDKHPEWATKFEPDVAGKVVYSDEEGALLRGFSALTGQYVYAPVELTGRYRIDVDSKLLDSKLSPELAKRLRAAKARLVAEEAANLRANPDGPFTNAKSNVVASETVDSRYSGYLAALMQDLGLGDIKVFLLHPEDVKAEGAIDKYKLYAEYASAQSAGMDPGEDGSLRAYGPKRDSFYISLRPGLSEARTLETIAHELGHLIQRVSYDNASSDVKAAIKTEYEQWLQTTKGASAKEVIESLRNRETAESHAATVGKEVEAKLLSPYWTSFSEWFADNVSKWATTDERPVSVVEKFFKSVADKLRALVAAVTGQRFAPAKSVAEFLNNMGPAKPVVWSGTVDTTAQPSRAVSPTEGIAEKSELMKDQPGPAGRMIRSASRIFLEKDDVPFVTRFRTEIADAYASVVNRLNILFDGNVRDNITGLTNPELLIRQAADAEKMFNAFIENGDMEKDATLGEWVVKRTKNVSSIADVLAAVKNWGDAKGMTFEQAYAETSKMMEAVRLNEIVKVNKAEKEAVFPIHKLAKADPRSAEEQIAIALRGLEANPEVKEILKMMDQQRFHMIDKLVSVGRISKEVADQWKEASGYVPFDRIDKFFDKFTPKRSAGRGLAQLGSLPMFKGTTRMEVGNVVDNHAKLMTWMLKQTLRQDANATTLKLLADIGQAKELGYTKSGLTNPNNVVAAYRNGREYYYEVRSHWDMRAFKDMQGPKMAITKVFAAVSQILRRIVTVMPPFVAKQVTDDIQRAFITSGVKHPSLLIIPAITNFLRIGTHELIFGKNHEFTKRFAEKGLVGEVDYNPSNPTEVALFNLGYSKRKPLRELHHRLESLTRASDLAIRKAIYDRTIKESKDEALALTRAREFINFRRRGASQTIGSAVATIPFFNAYIQASDVLLRSMTGRGSASVDRRTAARLFWTQAAKMVGFSVLYALANTGDDEYEKQDLRTRSDNWIVGGKRLPVPSDMAALFKVPVETVISYMSRLDTPQEQLASEAVKSALSYAFTQYSPIGGRMTPVPQAVKPIIEGVLNYSFVTGRPLTGIYKANLPAGMQAVSSTSELAKAIGRWASETMGVEISPIVIDNTLRGYFGGAVPLSNMLTDQLINPGKIDRPLSQYWFIGQYLLPDVPTGPKEEFYDLVNKVAPYKRALDDLSKNDAERAVEYAKAHEAELTLAAMTNIALTQLAQQRQYITFLESPNGEREIPNSAERLKAKQEVEKMINEQLSWLREAKQIYLGKK